MTDAILRDEPAPTHQSSLSLLSRCRDALVSIKSLCSSKEEFKGIALDTPLPRISPDLIERIIELRKFKEQLVEGPSYKDKLAYDLDLDLKAAIRPELVEEYNQLKVAESHARAHSRGQIASYFTQASSALKDELGNAYVHLKKANKSLGWAISDSVHTTPQTPEETVRRLAVDFRLMEHHSTAVRLFNHWRNAGAEYLELHPAAAVKPLADRQPT